MLTGREKVCFQQLSESCCADRSHERNVLETKKLIGGLPTPHAIMRTSFKVKGQRSRSSGRLMLRHRKCIISLWSKVCYIFRKASAHTCLICSWSHLGSSTSRMCRSIDIAYESASVVTSHVNDFPFCQCHTMRVSPSGRPGKSCWLFHGWNAGWDERSLMQYIYTCQH